VSDHGAYGNEGYCRCGAYLCPEVEWPARTALATADKPLTGRDECGWTGVYGWLNDAPAGQPCNLPDWHEGKHERGPTAPALDVEAQAEALDRSLLMTFQWSSKEHERHGLAFANLLRHLHEIGWDVTVIDPVRADEYAARLSTRRRRSMSNDDLSTRGIARIGRRMTSDMGEKDRLAQALREGDTETFVAAIRRSNPVAPDTAPDPLGLGRAVADHEATVEALAEAVRYVATGGVTDPDVSHTPDELDREYATALLAAMGRPVLRFAEPCRYCGSVNGETPPSAYSWDPQTGETVRAAIAAATTLTNPRLSEVDWDEVAAYLPPLCTHPEGAMTSNDDWIVCTRCNTRWPNAALSPTTDTPE
jgi:hypothetical protein